MSTACQNSTSAFLRSFDATDYQDIVGRILPWNRQSSRTKAAKGHTSKLKALATANKQQLRLRNMTVAKPFFHSGGGSLKQLNYGFFDSSNPISTLPPKLYFYNFHRRIQEELNSLPPGKKLMILVFSLDRLFRPERFKYDDPTTYEPQQSDFDLFEKFLNTCFGERTADLVFVTLHDGRWQSIKRVQAEAGQAKGVGGRPSKQQSKKHIAPDIKTLVVEKAVTEHWNATQLVNYLRNEHGSPLSKRQARRWLADAGASQPPYRPYKKADIISLNQLQRIGQNT